MKKKTNGHSCPICGGLTTQREIIQGLNDILVFGKNIKQIKEALDYQKMKGEE